jgi:hypothetical protein
VRYLKEALVVVGGLAVFGALLYFSKPPAPPPPPPASDVAAKVSELVAKLTVQDRSEGIEGASHKIKADVERELWSIVSALPVASGNDRVLMSAIDEVYTKYHKNYYNGYIFHYPYLDSVKAITLCDKLLREYPMASTAPQALWLKAFALRVNPPPPDHEVHESFDAQTRWRPRPEEARQVYRELVSRFPRHPYAEEARKRIEKPDLLLTLPTWFEEEDPRTH